MFCWVLVCVLFLFCVRGYEYQVKYLDVKLDQFTYNSETTFKLKYLYSDKHWNRDGGPIFFYCGNEGAVEVFAENTGFLWESAARFGALVVFAEHRYYGESLPFGNHTMDTVETRGFLSSVQALEDFADVITHLQQGLRKRHPVIAFGGSYGGMLATWFRIKYPHMVQGALAASAPIWGFTNMAPCNFYMKRVTEVFNNASSSCRGAIKASWGAIDALTESASGRQWLTQTWKLCTPLQSRSDVNNFKSWLSDMYTTLAMINYPYPNDFLRPVPGNPIKKFCEIFDNSRRSKILVKLYEASQIYLNYTQTEKCFKWESGSSVDDLGLEGWYLQTCTEMTIPFCSTESEMVEPYDWNFELFKNTCKRKFGVSPDPHIAEKLYGGYSIEAASNIIFSNGLLDPWSGAGVLANISSTLVAIVIPEGAHHLDLRPANKDDPQSVVDARKYYEKTFRKWISEFEAKELKRQEEQYRWVYNKETYDIEETEPGTKWNSGQSSAQSLGMYHPSIVMQHPRYSRPLADYPHE